LDQIPATVAGERSAAFSGPLAGDGFDLHDQFRGKNWADARNKEGFPSPPIAPQRIACATC
jgi:hypothetical protein